MAIFGMVFPAITAAKMFLSMLLLAWYAVLRKFVSQLGDAADSPALFFLLFSLIGLSNFFWTGFISYQLGLLLLTLFLTRFKPSMSAKELAIFALLIFLSHAMVFLIFLLLVLLQILNTAKRGHWVLALFPAGILSLWFVIGRSFTDFNSPLAGASMAGWKEVVIYKLGYPLMLGPFKNLLQPDLISLVDHFSWLYWTGFLANILVISGIGIFILFVIWPRKGAMVHGETRTGLSQRSLRICVWVLLLFYLLAPYNFFGLINPSGRITIPLLLVSLLLVRKSVQVTSLTRLLRVLAPITLCFTFFTVFTYAVLMQRAESPEYLAKRPEQIIMPAGVSVLQYNNLIYSKARYNYFNYRIFGFSTRFRDIELERYNRLVFRTALLVGYKEP